MGRKLAWLVVAASVAWLVPAWALSLGGIRIHSRLNQPLTASIPLVAGPGEVMDESVKVRVASNEDFARAGLERLEFLSDLSFTVEGSRVVVTSRKIAREPVIDLLLEVRWGGGRLLRQYTLLLDPEGIGATPAPLEQLPPPSAAPPAPAPAAAAGGTRPSGSSFGPGNVGGSRARGLREDAYPPAAAPSSAPERSSSAPSSMSSSRPRTYGPIKPNETPWSVASKLKPDDSVSVEQVIIALFQWNPTAFGSSLATFRPGAVLRVPDAEVVRRVDPQIAKARIAEARSKAAEAQAAAPKPEEKPPALQPLPEPSKPAAAEKPAPVETPPPPKPEPPPAAKAEPAPTPPATTTTPAPTTPSPAPETAPAPPAETAPAPTAEAPAETKAEEPAPVTEEPTPTRRRKDEGLNWTLLIGIAVGALILIVLVWRLMRRPKSPGEDFATPDFASAPAGPTARPAAAARPAQSVFEEPAQEAPAPPPPRAAPPPPPEPAMPEPAARARAPEPAPAAPAAPAPAPAKPAPAFVDTALTDTRQIDLEGGDALAEADFHLAYGLYDEAILLLTQALTRDPARNDVRTKLAEAYFSANRGQEFMETARSLKDKLDPAGWEKIAVLGRQLFPNEGLFGGGGKAQPAPAGETARAAPRPPEPPKPAPKAAEASIPFELEPLDLNAPLEQAATPAAGMLDAGVDLESNVSLDDQALGGDEATTKLDLARAYIDLGDNDMARGLLSEVLQQGSNDQKGTAEELMRKLPA